MKLKTESRVHLFPKIVCSLFTELLLQLGLAAEGFILGKLGLWSGEHLAQEGRNVINADGAAVHG